MGSAEAVRLGDRHCAGWTLAVVILLATFGASWTCPPNPTPQAPPPPGAWLVLLCKAADAPQEPHPKSFYEELFSRQQRDLLFDYFDAASNHTVDVSGSEVYGWFSMSVNTADIAPNVRNNSTPVTRNQTANDCRASALGAILATGKSIDPSNYAGVLTVINVPVDTGATGKSVVVFNQEATEVGFIVHEMLHVLGLTNWMHAHILFPDGSTDHAWGDSAYDEYGDRWDMMSFRDSVYGFTTAHGFQGPELQGAYREKLKWMPPSRVYVKDAYVSATNTITLAPVSDPSKPGYLLAKIEIPNEGYYVVEYREKSGFDRGIPFNAVVIREQRYNGHTYLVKRQAGTIAWRKGDTFTDAGNYLSISVDDMVPGTATITINPAYSPVAAKVGDICGDKYRGQVIPCPAGTRCDARRTPPLVTIDYFCQ